MGKYRKFHQSGLHDLLVVRLKHVPGLIESGRILPAVLAKSCDRCKYTVYRWMNDEKLPMAAAKQIVALSVDPETDEPTLSLEDLIPYL